MCEPATMMMMATVASATAAGVAGYGSYQSGQFNQAVAENNAIMAKRQADDAIRRGNLAEAQSRRSTDALIGTQKAAMSASNTVVSEGTNLAIREDTRAQGELEALNIRNNAERHAAGLNFDAQNYQAQGKFSALQGKYGLAEGALNVGGSVLGGVSKYNASKPLSTGGVRKKSNRKG